MSQHNTRARGERGVRKTVAQQSYEKTRERIVKQQAHASSNLPTTYQNSGTISNLIRDACGWEHFTCDVVLVLVSMTCSTPRWGAKSANINVILPPVCWVFFSRFSILFVLVHFGCSYICALCLSFLHPYDTRLNLEAARSEDCQEIKNRKQGSILPSNYFRCPVSVVRRPRLGG